MKWVLILIVFLATSCAELRRQEERWTVEEKQAYLKHSPEWTPSVKADILRGAVQMGMTTEQVRMSIGKPRVVNQTVGRWGVHEQWVYDWMYLYLDNGIVTGWQRKR